MLWGCLSSNEHGVVCQKLVLRDFQVKGRRPLASAPGGVIVTAVAGAEPAVVVAGVGQGHAAYRTGTVSSLGIVPCRTLLGTFKDCCRCDGIGDHCLNNAR